VEDSIDDDFGLLDLEEHGIGEPREERAAHLAIDEPIGGRMSSDGGEASVDGSKKLAAEGRTLRRVPGSGLRKVKLCLR